MTKKEFIQEAALRMITVWPGIEKMSYIAGKANELADEVYGNDEKEIMTGFPSDESIQVLIKEVDRMDLEAKKKEQEKSKTAWPG